MAGYMTQEIFNMCAVSTAKLSAASSKTLEEMATLIGNNYKNTYQDKHLVSDIEFAAKKVIEFMLGVLPAETLVGNLTQMQFCIKNYNLDGTKKRMKIFGGTFFAQEKQENTDKVQSCLVNIATYHFLVIRDTIPIAP